MALPGFMTSGGLLEEIPKPHKRYYDDRRRKRDVRVSIMIFDGVGRHYYVHITEDDNPIWNTTIDKFDNEPEGWQIARDDQVGTGVRIHKKFNTAKQAERFVRKILKKDFPRNRYRHLWNDRPRKWFYSESD